MGDKQEKPKRQLKLKSEDPKIFKEAYHGLEKGVKYAESHDFISIYRCLKQELEEHTPRFEQLTNQPTQSNPC